MHNRSAHRPQYRADRALITRHRIHYWLKMDRLRGMEVFVAVVEAGNFTLAGTRLGVTAVMVGKQIRQLEELVGARLLQRNTRQQNLTEAGQSFYASPKTILEQVRRAQESIYDLASTPTGSLRVSAPVSMGGCLVTPLIAAYLRKYPEVCIELVLDNSLISLIDASVDLAIRVGPVADSRMIARKLKPYQSLICGSPDYLRQRGTPQTWADLGQHLCLRHLAWDQTWYAEDGQALNWPHHAVFASNDGYALREAALSGAGLVLQPEALLAEPVRSGRLVPVLTPYLPPAQPVHLLYLRDSLPRRALAGLIEFLVEELGA